MRSELRAHASFSLLSALMVVALWLLIECQFFYSISIDKYIDRHHVIGADVVELAPIEGMIASDFLAARLAYKICGHAIRRRAW